MEPREKIAVLDFGSQYSQLIARRVRENRVYSFIVDHNIGPEELRKLSPKGIILSGGPASVYGQGAPRCDPSILRGDIPALGICYGMQLMSFLLGGKVERGGKREYGRAELFLEKESPLFERLDKTQTVWMSHGDKVVALPSGYEVLGRTSNSEVAVMGDQRSTHFGLQFHPEVLHTVHGNEILRNFLFRVCGCGGDWNMESFRALAIREIRDRVGKGKVILGVSGGVDSSVAAHLLHEAIGEQLSCIFVNNGLLRKGEAEEVRERFRKREEIKLIYVDAEKEFLTAIDGVVDPEEKRKIIGAEFIRAFERAAEKLKDARFLAQGTLYPDVIESRSPRGGPSATIKTHHNVGGLPESLNFELIEPLKNLFKDEVRRLGEEMGMPEEVVWRHPFPGPGLAVRIIGEVTRERLDLLREADARFVEEIEAADYYRKIAQAFVVLLPVKTVGVMGDERTYENVVAIRAVTTSDFMTADWVQLPYDLLARISNRIINEVRGINRVVYDISSKPPSTIEWE
ncbi:MAG: glutamine-hydrolyzing GMP synthase [bacterium]|nr:glutamine-hydrolyzing GMP synthase [bacterium]